MLKSMLVKKMIINVLASGSKGNCTYIETKNKHILIDLGISNKRITDGLKNIGKDIGDIDLICITHEHIDHIAGLGVTLKKSNALVILTEGTYKGIMNSKNKDCAAALFAHQQKGLVKILKKNGLMYQTLNFEDLNITAIATFHDAFESCGYVFEELGKKIVYITDTGYVHHDLEKIISDADAYVMETNHDPQILMASSRPYPLKMRILSDHGHMSNEDAFILLAHILTEKTKYVFCAHISEECNLIEIINYTKDLVYKKLEFESNAQYIITSQTQSKVYEI